MTANQIAYAQAIEQEEHNEATEKETTRHNLVLEELERENVRLEEQRVNADREYKQQSLWITQQYNEKSLELQKADLAQRDRIQSELNRIKQREADNQEWYQRKKAELDAIGLSINDRIATETANHNIAMEVLESQAQAQVQWFQEKKTQLEQLSVLGEQYYNQNRIYLDAARLRLSEFQTEVDALLKKSELQIKQQLGSEANKINLYSAVSNSVTKLMDTAPGLIVFGLKRVRR